MHKRVAGYQLCIMVFGLLLCSIPIVAKDAQALENFLSHDQNLLFEYDLQKNEAQSNKLKKSWINPVMLRYSKDFSQQFGEKTIQTRSFTISIDQPIFRSGGIYYAIKYAQALQETNSVGIRLKKRQMIAEAVKLLLQIKKSKLELKKLKLLIKNDQLNIRQKQEQYQAGLLDSSFLDQAILKKNQDEAVMLQTQANMYTLYEKFSLLSDKDPDRLDPPRLKLIPKTVYKKHHLELLQDSLKVEKADYNTKVTWAKYMPVLSLQGRYHDEDINPLFARSATGLKEQYKTYGLTLTMPLDIKMFDDVEASKVEALKAKLELIERKKSVDKEYETLLKRLKILEKKIILAKKSEKLYRNLYKVTKNLVKAGEKTKYDAFIIYNSMLMSRLDEKIAYYDKQIELLELYAKIEGI